jgi:hypothetical protein
MTDVSHTNYDFPSVVIWNHGQYDKFIMGSDPGYEESKGVMDLFK